MLLTLLCIWSLTYKVLIHVCLLNTQNTSFPDGPVVKNSPCNVGSIPGPWRSHMPWSNKASAPQLLSLSSRTSAPPIIEPTRCNNRTHRSEKAVHCNKDSAQTKINYSFLRREKKVLEVKAIAGSEAAWVKILTPGLVATYIKPTTEALQETVCFPIK